MLHGIKAATKRTPLRKSGSEGFVSQDPCDHNMGAKRLALASLPAGLPLGSALPSHVNISFTRQTSGAHSKANGLTTQAPSGPPSPNHAGLHA